MLETFALSSRGYPLTQEAFLIWDKVSNLWRMGEHREAASLAHHSIDYFIEAVRSERRKHQRKLLKMGIEVMAATVDAYREEVEHRLKQKAMESLGYAYV
jgi:hypothetical protein